MISKLKRNFWSFRWIGLCKVAKIVTNAVIDDDRSFTKKRERSQQTRTNTTKVSIPSNTHLEKIGEKNIQKRQNIIFCSMSILHCIIHSEFLLRSSDNIRTVERIDNSVAPIEQKYFSSSVRSFSQYFNILLINDGKSVQFIFMLEREWSRDTLHPLTRRAFCLSTNVVEGTFENEADISRIKQWNHYIFDRVKINLFGDLIKHDSPFGNVYSSYVSNVRWSFFFINFIREYRRSFGITL